MHKEWRQSIGVTLPLPWGDDRGTETRIDRIRRFRLRYLWSCPIDVVLGGLVLLEVPWRIAVVGLEVSVDHHSWMPWWVCELADVVEVGNGRR